MAFIQTDYGLVYNDDGSLCVTVREDDIPFPGVKSFAVEEGTTNLLTNPAFTTGDLTGWGTVLGTAGSVTVVEYSYINPYSAKIVSDGSAYIGLNSSSTTAVEGDTFTGSAYLYSDTNKAFIQLRFFDSTGAVLLDGTASYISKTNQWNRVTVTDTAPANTASVILMIRIYTGYTGTVYVNSVQLEQKSFATSFVDGTRATGTLKIPLTFTNDFVIHTWSKMTQDIIGTRRLWHVQTAEGSNANSFFWEQYSTTQWLFRYFNTSGTIDDYLFDLTNDTSQWNMYTFVWTGSEYLFYVNDTKIYTLTASLYFTPLYIKIASYPINITDIVTWGLFANFLIGQYKDTNGNVIWTDDYIKYVYEQKKPFADDTNLFV